MDDETLFGWIHLSDIHFGHGDAGHGWDQDLVMGALRRDIAQNPAPVRVDAVFVTGDIAFSGAGRSADEYDRARKWLLEVGEAAGVKPDRIFLVPGNHDVNRNADAKNKSTGRLIKALRSRATPEQAIDDALKDAEDRKLLASRMEKYLDLSATFGPWAGRDPMPPATERLFWTSSFTARGGLSVRLVGLNTALLSRDDDDPGQLRLGNEQLARAFAKDRAQNEIILALSHHPLRKGWLGDEGNADRWIRNHAQAHLSGHVHEAESEGARSGSGGEFVRVTAGAAHNDQLPAWIPQTHGYNFGEIRRAGTGAALLRIHPRLWSAPSAEFVLDVHSVPKAKRGGPQPTFAEHEVAVVLPEPGPGEKEPPAASGAAGAATSKPEAPRLAPPTGPIRVFFSYAPEDEGYAKKLANHLSGMVKLSRTIESFSSRSVGAGEDWRGKVDENLARAQIILLLLSDDYIGSDYCTDVEMDLARRRHEAGEVVVIPVLLRPLDLKRREDTSRQPHWFEELQRIPRAAEGQGLVDGKPVAEWADVDRAWTEVARAIRAKVEELRATR